MTAFDPLAGIRGTKFRQGIQHPIRICFRFAHLTHPFHLVVSWSLTAPLCIGQLDSRCSILSAYSLVDSVPYLLIFWLSSEVGLALPVGNGSLWVVTLMVSSPTRLTIRIVDNWGCNHHMLWNSSLVLSSKFPWSKCVLNFGRNGSYAW